MRSVPLLVAIGLTGCWRQSSAPTVRAAAGVTTQPAPSARTPQPSYQALNAGISGAGIVLLGAGIAVIANDGSDDLAAPLTISGAALAGLGGPVLHLMHGRGERALAGYLFRSIATSAGLVVGWATTCNDDREWFCGFDGMAYGTFAGLAVGAAADAIFLHGRDEEAGAWTPTVSHSDGTTRIGIGGAF